MIPWYNERICLNVLAKDHHNAIDIYEAMDGHVLVGVLSTRYPSLEVAVPDLKQYQAEIKDAVSLGLGLGIQTNGVRLRRLRKKSYRCISIRCSVPWDIHVRIQVMCRSSIVSFRQVAKSGM